MRLATKLDFQQDTGRQYIHIIQSFSEFDRLDAETAHEIGQKLLGSFEGFQGVVATHTDRKQHSRLNMEEPYRWADSTVASILEHEEDLGHTINCRTYTPSFKNKKKRENLPDKWLRFENTHEPLIDQNTWDIVRKVRQGKRRPTKMGEQDILSGLVFCKDCGSKHYFCRCGRWNED